MPVSPLPTPHRSAGACTYADQFTAAALAFLVAADALTAALISNVGSRPGSQPGGCHAR